MCQEGGRKPPSLLAPLLAPFERSQMSRASQDGESQGETIRPWPLVFPFVPSTSAIATSQHSQRPRFSEVAAALMPG
jgi:hypothetical protein